MSEKISKIVDYYRVPVKVADIAEMIETGFWPRERVEEAARKAYALGVEDGATKQREVDATIADDQADEWSNLPDANGAAAATGVAKAIRAGR